MLEKFLIKNSQKITNRNTFFEFNFLGEKVITNSGYYQDYKHQLNSISKSTASHSTLVLDDTSNIKFERDKHGHMLANKNYKILSKEIRSEKDFWLIKASHDAYTKSYRSNSSKTNLFFPQTNKKYKDMINLLS